MGNRVLHLSLGLIVLLSSAAGVLAGELKSVERAKAAAANPKLSAEDVLLKFVAAEEDFASLVKAATRTAGRAELEWEWAQLLSAKGVFILTRIEQKPALRGVVGPTAIDALRGAVAHYDAAAEGREEVLRSLPAAKKRSEAGVQLSWDARRARFHSCAAEYRLGQALPKGSTAREDQQQTTLAKLSDFVWDNEDNVLGGHAYLYMGLAHQDLGQDAKALEFLRLVANSYPAPPETDAENSQKWTDLFLQGYFKLAEHCNRASERGGKGYLEAAVSVLSTMGRRVPDFQKRQFGQLAMIEQAKALNGLGRVKEARRILIRVVVASDSLPEETFWKASTKYLANQALAQITEEGVLPATVRELWGAAVAKQRTRDWGDAEEAFLAVIDACRTDLDFREFGIRAWMEIGECCYRDERFMDAFHAYDHLLQLQLPAPDWLELAGDAAYYRYRSATALHNKVRTAEARELKLKARMDFATDFPDHPRAIDLRYYAGADLVAEADALRGSNQEEAAVRAYHTAIENFGSVKATSVLFAKSRARIVEVFYKLGAWNEALAKMEEVLAYIDAPKNVTTDPQRLANRLLAGATATYYGARAAEQKGDWPAVVRILTGFEERFAGETVKGFVAPAIAILAKAQKELAAQQEEDAPSDD